MMSISSSNEIAIEVGWIMHRTTNVSTEEHWIMKINIAERSLSTECLHMWHILPLLNNRGRKKNMHMQTAMKIARLADMMQFQDRSSTQPAISHRHKFEATNCRTTGMEDEGDIIFMCLRCLEVRLG